MDYSSVSNRVVSSANWNNFASDCDPGGLMPWILTFEPCLSFLSSCIKGRKPTVGLNRAWNRSINEPNPLCKVRAKAIFLEGLEQEGMRYSINSFHLVHAYHGQGHIDFICIWDDVMQQTSIFIDCAPSNGGSLISMNNAGRNPLQSVGKGLRKDIEVGG